MSEESEKLLRETFPRIVKDGKRQGVLNQEQFEELMLLPLGDLDELDNAYKQLRYYTTGSGGTGVKITNDEHFDKACTWLVERARIIEEGDATNGNSEQWQKERAEHMRKFNIVDREILLYNMPWVVEAWDKAKQPKTELDAWLE